MGKLDIHEWIKRCNELQAENEKLREEKKNSAWGNLDEQLDWAKDNIDILEQENAKLRACVEFYAKHENHDFDNNDYYDDRELVEYYEVYDKDSNAFLTIDPEDKRRVGDNIEGYEDYMIGKRARKCLAELDEGNSYE